jgi:hypothetical protein
LGDLKKIDAERLHALHEEDGSETTPADLVTQIELIVLDALLLEPLGETSIGHASAHHLCAQYVLDHFFPDLPFDRHGFASSKFTQDL